MSAFSLELDDRHMAALELLAKEKDMSKTAVLRQALRMYQHIDSRIKKGEQMAFVKDGQIVKQEIIGCGEVP